MKTVCGMYCLRRSTEYGRLCLMDTMTTLLERLEALNGGEIVSLAKTSGVPYNTILNIRKGVTTDPRVSTVDALMAELGKKKRRVAEA